MRSRTQPWVRLVGIWCLVYTLVVLLAFPEGQTGRLIITGQPAWVPDSAGLDGNVVVDGIESVSALEIHFQYPGAQRETTPAQRDPADSHKFAFKIPAQPDSGPGELTVVAEAMIGTSGGTRVRSDDYTIPLALEKELDITGDAAIALYYPLGGTEYTVRYVPCCNIFGGITIATRVPVNPVSNDDGLPAKRLSDFIVLKPDGLSASTMGMYFDFALGPDRLKDVIPALYEFDGVKWVEFKTYEVDTATGRISMHCPNGGTFVVMAKP